MKQRIGFVYQVHVLGALGEMYMQAYLAWCLVLGPPCVRNKRDNINVKLWQRISINSQYAVQSFAASGNLESRTEDGVRVASTNSGTSSQCSYSYVDGDET